jgi:hypothetical protein
MMDLIKINTGSFMRVPALDVVNNIVNEMQKKGANIASFSWAEFYPFCGRIKLKESYLEEIRAQAEVRNLVFARGNAAVFFITNINFAPL